MIARSFILAVCVAVLSPGLPRAQEAPSSDRKMYEDIEILRRILNGKLHALYSSKEAAFVPIVRGGPRMLGDNDVILVASAKEVSYQLEGVYLKGQGVVYTVTLPTLDRSVKVATAKPISEWDSVRREFHKEKETPQKSDEGKTAGLREVLLKVLAENGHHFSRLGENESLTIVVTVHEENKPQPPAKANKKEMKTITTWTFPESAASSKVRDHELLGDLHLKQARHDEAIASFLKAIELATGSKRKAALHRKLAQVYLMKGQDEKARSQIDKVIEFLKKAADTASLQKMANDVARMRKLAPAVKATAEALPVKMIISVPKKLLDQAGEGKMTFDEFCRRAKVETLNFVTEPNPKD